MAERESAKARVEDAVARLETAILSVTDTTKASELEKERGQLTAELTSLKGEHKGVSEQLQALQGDYKELEKVVDQVTDRLDTTIDRLRSVLEA
jgi:predicted  nucleic acid-binding Zn-ribbon protein